MRRWSATWQREKRIEQRNMMTGGNGGGGEGKRQQDIDGSNMGGGASGGDGKRETRAAEGN